MNRREFLGGTAWMGALAAAAGCVSNRQGDLLKGIPASMQGFAVPPLKKVRIGIIGVGRRAQGALKRLSSIPGSEIVAVCDIIPERVDNAIKVVTDNKAPAPKGFKGEDSAERMLQEDFDVAYIVTGWKGHAPLAIKAMEAGKHAMIEVPSATTLEECWALVETAERTHRHCMQLENCCYGEAELLCLNLARQNRFGELVLGEAAYIHDLHEKCWFDAKTDAAEYPNGYTNHWRLRYNAEHKGNQYHTHGLVPLCEYMNINRGDRFDYLVSLESDQHRFEETARLKYPGTWKTQMKIAMGDMNQTLIRTVKGRTILVQHDVSSPRPYTRLNMLTGTEGIFQGIKFSKGLEDQFGYSDPSVVKFGWKCPDSPAKANRNYVENFFGFNRMQRLREECMHPLWRTVGEVAKAIGGHGGMDFVMDVRWNYCLQNGLPLDTDVYDLASVCSLGELTERSVRSHSEPQDVPDFTRGGWRTAKPLGIVDVDLVKMGLDPSKITTDKNALNV